VELSLGQARSRYDVDGENVDALELKLRFNFWPRDSDLINSRAAGPGIPFLAWSGRCSL
jgi:hypothetical protein